MKDGIDGAANLRLYTKGRKPHFRDASWGYCYSFFRDHREQRDALRPGGKLHRQACMELAAYMASWGMYRGSGPLLQRSAVQFGPVVEAMVNADAEGTSLWDLDVDRYGKETFTLLEAEVSRLRGALKKWPVKDRGVTPTVVTKLMLGVYGCVPAFDDYVRQGAGSFCKRTITRLGQFWSEQGKAIERVAPSGVFDFDRYKRREVRHDIRWTQAKVLDAVFYVAGGGLGDLSPKG